MAEEKKPKIDLKTRLQKMGGQANVAVTNPGPPRLPGSPSIPPPAIPIPPGLPSPFQSSRPAPLDPNNPLSALASPFRSQAPPPPAPAVAQRIEVDEGAIHEARSSVRKQMIVVALLLGVVFAFVGYLIGSGTAKSAEHTAGVNDAHLIATDLQNAQASLVALAAKVSDGKKTLDSGKFPDGLDQDLNKINIDFDGSKLAERHLSAIPKDAMKSLIDVITAVQALNTKKTSLAASLSKNRQAINDWFGFKGNPPFTFALVIDRDAINNGSVIAPFATPLSVPNDKPLPEKFSLINNKTSVEVTRYLGTELKDRVALPLAPGAEVAICGPSANAQNLVGQLKVELLSVVADIQKESSDDPSATAQKVGLKELTNNLISTLNHI